jgi:hypothetical protein
MRSTLLLFTIVAIGATGFFFLKYVAENKNEIFDSHKDTNRFSLVSYEYVNGEAFRVYVDKNTKIEYLQTSTGMVMLKEKL